MNADVFYNQLKLCDGVCEYLSRTKDLSSASINVKSIFRYDLLKFAVYLADSDNVLETEEILIMRKLLGVDVVVNDMRVLKSREHIAGGYKDEVPLSIRYAVQADGKPGARDNVYKGQCAMILFDTYRSFGKFFIALHQNDPTDKTSLAYTEYLNNIEKYLKEKFVFVPYNKKAFPVQELNDETVSEAVNKSKIEDSTAEQDSYEDKLEKATYGVPVTENPVKGTEFEDMNLEEKLEEFHDMVGLNEVKKEVDSLINLIRIQKLRAKNGLKNTETSKHMVFTGNPGTGKTTVARILASIYKDLGVLEKGTFVEVDRSGLVKGFVGQTAIQVKKVVEEAKGGILFIDEAYTLTVNRGDNDYGQEAVDTLLKAMEDMRENLIVIVAGYPDLMAQFLESNPGLKSRFNKFIDFKDYTVEEQMMILDKMCQKQEYSMSNEVRTAVYHLLTEKRAFEQSNSANARDIRNMLENAIMRQATRLIQYADPTKEMLTALEVEDFLGEE